MKRLLILIPFLLVTVAAVFTPSPNRQPTLRGINAIGGDEPVTHLEINMSDAGGERGIKFKDSSGTEVAYLNSDGTLDIRRMQAQETTNYEIRLKDAAGTYGLRITDSNGAQVYYLGSDGDIDTPDFDVDINSGVTITAKSGQESAIFMGANAGINNADWWKIRGIVGENWAVDSYQGGSWDSVLILTNTGALAIDDFTAVGADPLCWDGDGTSYIGDCSASKDQKQDIKAYDITNENNKIKSITEPERLRIEGHYPPNQKIYTSNIEMLKDITVYTAQYKIKEEQTDRDRITIMSEQLYDINPLLVNIRDGKVTGVAWFDTISWLIKVNQEQQAQIEDLQSRVEVLEKK